MNETPFSLSLFTLRATVFFPLSNFGVSLQGQYTSQTFPASMPSCSPMQDRRGQHEDWAFVPDNDPRKHVVTSSEPSHTKVTQVPAQKVTRRRPGIQHLQSFSISPALSQKSPRGRFSQVSLEVGPAKMRDTDICLPALRNPAADCCPRPYDWLCDLEQSILPEPQIFLLSNRNISF